ncbi:MAG TPA: ribonuclease BN, partial [Gammaproteobacteria bacterium]|nr:ribonuclease BN [Gammaproteobacteria bacterium]
MILPLQGIKTFIWQKSPEQGGFLKKYTVWLLRILYVVGRDIMHGQLTLRASSLSYTTLLSLVPLLAVS